jgi:dTDP-4-dehydrorhamnose 3,5-epimerase
MTVQTEPAGVAGVVIPEIRLIETAKFTDMRGFFSETYNRERMRRDGIAVEFVQDNHSLSRAAGTLRGLHFQRPPFAQAKLMRVIRGRIWDVAVDIRHGSPSFGKWMGVELSAETGQQLYVPTGFAHGFVTLESDTEIFYKVSNYYAPDHDLGIRWDDPDLGILWPLAGKEPVLSERDRNFPALSELPVIFEYPG